MARNGKMDPWVHERWYTSFQLAEEQQNLSRAAIPWVASELGAPGLALALMSASRRRPASLATVVEVRADGLAGARALLTRLRRSAERFLDTLELRDVELSILLTDDPGIRTLNRMWRRKDKATDVLSFPAGEPPPGASRPRHLGDIILSLDTARRQARIHRRSVNDELDLYLAHGLLHLLGHDHHRRRDAERMAALEARLLGRPGMVPPR